MQEDGVRPLSYHLKEVKEGRSRFENAFQSVARLILQNKDMIEKILVHGKGHEVAELTTTARIGVQNC